MKRMRNLLFAFIVLALGVAQPILAGCSFMMVDRTEVSYELEGVTYTNITEYWGWVCTDCCFEPVWGTPYAPGDPIPPPPTQPPPEPPPPPPTGCSLAACLRDCDAHYLATAGVMVVGETITEYVGGVSCDFYCLEGERLNWDICRGTCITDCNLP